MITKCKCGKDIMYVRTPSGRQQVVDLTPVKMWVKDPDEHIYAQTECYTAHVCGGTEKR